MSPGIVCGCEIKSLMSLFHELIESARNSQILFEYVINKSANTIVFVLPISVIVRVYVCWGI